MSEFLLSNSPCLLWRQNEEQLLCMRIPRNLKSVTSKFSKQKLVNFKFTVLFFFLPLSQINFPLFLSLIGISLDCGEVRPNFVRGFNHPCGWFCVPLKDYPSHSLLTGYIQTELRGMLPQSAVDTAMSSTLANFYSDLKKALKTQTNSDLRAHAFLAIKCYCLAQHRLATE